MSSNLGKNTGTRVDSCLVFDCEGISINANKITLDLNGFTLSSTANPPSGIAISLQHSLTNLTIANGTMLLYGSGKPNFSYTVLANTELEPSHWAPIGTSTAGPLGTLQFFDHNAVNFKQRFYRFTFP